MTWATVITLSIIGFFGAIGALEKQPGPEAALKFFLNLWLLGCAYAMWDRYL